ncbi:MAG: zinc metallopeptidase [Oscillospiraceae bacterium]|nr:zinc metallopeptidase [Oscillospiraceae bacterium]
MLNGYYNPYYYDPTYILVIAAFLLSAIASFGVKITFARYSGVRNTRGLTGADAAKYVLSAGGVNGVRIERVSGNLTDHFDPKAGVIRLSDSTYASTSVAAVGVAAHEAGHAIQHDTGYVPIKLRNGMVPVVNIGNVMSMPVFMLGLILGRPNLAMIGVILFSGVLVFQLLTLPVEFNASIRAMRILRERDLLGHHELPKAKKVLFAAAMTYVAAVAATALQIIRLLGLLNRRRR